jgi:hypothetical protein
MNEFSRGMVYAEESGLIEKRDKVMRRTAVERDG